MYLRRLLTLPLLAICLYGIAASNASWAEEDKKLEGPAPDTKAIDAHVYRTLKDVINAGSDLYNSVRPTDPRIPVNPTGWIECYRLYEGALTAFRPLLAHRPKLQKAIDDGLAEAKSNPIIPDKAFVLRRVIDQIRTETNPNPTPVTPVAKTLWERLDGEKGVRKVIDDFVAAAAADPAVNFDRGGKYTVNVPDLKKKLVEFVSSATGGPPQLRYTGKDMKEVHKGMGITDAEYDAAVKHLTAALKKNGVKVEDAKEVLDVVGSLRKEIVEKKPEPEPTAKTLWDRLDGEKGVRKVIDDFVATAAADPKVNFFRDGKYKDKVDVPALKQKLVELVSSATGGKLTYTGKSMKEVHKGMGITEEEFKAAAGHLEGALKKNGVKDEDVKKVMAVVNGMKDDIVEPKKPEPEPVGKTLWERLGKEEGVAKVVDDFVSAVANDPKVNFFRDPTFKPMPDQVKKLKKSLIDYISSVSGGPREYKGPDMKKVHAGMKITEEEFNATANHLEAALKKNMVGAADVKTVMEAVGKTKKDIVEPK